MFAVVVAIVVMVVRFGEGVLHDLTHTLGPNTMTWPGSRNYERKEIAWGYKREGFWYESYEFCMAEHTGTHLDAPSHFAEGMWSLEQIPLDHLIAPGVVVDMQDKVAKDPLAELTTDDLMAWLDKHGPLPDRAIILLRTGWASRYGNKTAYFGTSTNDTNNLIFPGMSVGAAQILTSYEQVSGRKVVGVGLDAPSIDYGSSKLFPTHVELNSHNIYILENVGDMSALPATGFELIVMPMKMRSGSGGPARIIAKILDGSSVAPHLQVPPASLLVLLLFIWGL